MSINNGEIDQSNVWTREPAEEGQVARLFCNLQERAFTGIVEISSSEKQVLLTFDTGDPVFVEESTLGDSLAQAMLERGIITREQYSSIVERMTEELVDNEDLRFCEIALELGYLTSEQVFDSITGRVREKVTDAVGWRDCEITLEDTRGEYGGHERFRVSIGPLILEGIKTHYDELRVNACLGASALQFVRRRDPAGSIAARFDLTEEETRMIRACDGATTTDAVVRHSGLAPLHAWQLFCALKLSSSVEFSPETSERRREGESVVETLPRFPFGQGGVNIAPASADDRLQSEDTARNIEPRAAPSFDRQPTAGAPPADAGNRRLHPPAPRAAAATTSRTGSVSEVFRSPREGVPRRTAQTPLKRSALALDRLSQELRKRDVKLPAGKKIAGPTAVKELLKRIPQKPEVKEEPIAPEPGGDPAREAWKKGRRYLLQQHLARASEEFRRACEIEPEQGAYRLYYLWTAFRDAPTSSDRESSQNELKKLAEAHTCAAGHEGFAYYVLGHLALLEKNDRSAEKYFKKASEMDRNLRDAERYHRLLVNRRQKG